VKGLEKLTKLEKLYLSSFPFVSTPHSVDNPTLTKAQIAELKKVLPKCEIYRNPTLTKEEFIEAAIRKAAKKPTGELTKADLEKVTKLSFSGKKLTEVPKGLEKLTKLEELYLNNNRLTDVKGLEKLTQLRELHLSLNQLTDVKGLEKLTQLQTLWLTNNPDLTKAQIDQLQKALPNCKISSNPKK